ncbi:multidrug resistance protein, MFS superfamily [Legionella beliardensis]|uniref:Bcr/CflA family efflux transporter n=1 Tax=Legionella beliardensis TaxID=91822 RepID=A0A378I2W3_9GAMM|nr:multidrug effflux MFS transporter [Legionella beliardensis]STX29527.1 multidrug resistance protein, MFS superfamily [Legionella beliardensis]
MTRNYQTSQELQLLILIIFISSLGQINSDLYLPSLPNMANKLQVSTTWIQMTVVIYMVGFSVSQLVYGAWSDAIGRRKPLITGLVIVFLGSVLCCLAPTIHILLLGRFLQGLGAGAGLALTRPILRDLFENKKLAIYNSYLSISSVVVLSAAPILGGYIEHFAGWRYNFLFLSVYNFTILYLFYLKLPETSQYYHQDNFQPAIIFNNMMYLLKSNLFLKFVLPSLLTYAGILACMTALPIVLQGKVGLSPVQFGWLSILVGSGFAFGGFINARLVGIYGINAMMIFGFLSQFSAGLFMLVFYLLSYLNTWVIIIPIIIFMFGSSLVFPNSSTGALIPFPKIAGTAGAVFGFMQILGGAFASGLIAFFHDENQLPMAIAFLLTSVLSIILFYLLKPTT